MIRLLLCLFLTLFAQGKDLKPVQKTDFLRVVKNETAAQLQTSNTTYRKGKQRVTLIGAIHIADQAYYQQLNEEFQKYDRLLYEMIGGEDLTRLQDKKDSENHTHLLAKTYAMIARFLKLTEQINEIDYLAKNFVHGDLTLEEFETLQEERDESILSFALQSGMEGDPAAAGSMTKILKGLLTGNADLVKHQLIGTLGQGDEQVAGLTGESVIINDRNAKCLEVLAAQFKLGHQNCAIFYGAAHFPDMENSLLEMGFTKSKQTWITAWNVPH